MDDTFKIVMGGESASNFYEGYQRSFPGSTWDGLDFNYTNGKYYINSHVYKDIAGFEIIVADVLLNRDLIIEEGRLGRDVIVMRALKQNVTYNTEEHRVEVGDNPAQGIFLYNSNVSTEIFLPKDTPMEVVTIRFSIDSFDSFTRGQLPELKNYLQQIDSVVMYQTLTHKMETALLNLFRVQTTKFGKQGYSFIYAIELMMLFSEQLQSRVFGDESSSLSKYDYERMLLIRQDLLENLAEPPQTNELCERYALSAQKLRNDFKSVFGMPPYQFVLHNRFEIAYRHLADNEKSIKEVAFDLGFANANHFNKAFKKHFGVSAGKIQKTNKLN